LREVREAGRRKESRKVCKVIDEEKFKVRSMWERRFR